MLSTNQATMHASRTTLCDCGTSLGGTNLVAPFDDDGPARSYMDALACGRAAVGLRRRAVAAASSDGDDNMYANTATLAQAGFRVHWALELGKFPV